MYVNENRHMCHLRGSLHARSWLESSQLGACLLSLRAKSSAGPTEFLMGGSDTGDRVIAGPAVNHSRCHIPHYGCRCGRIRDEAHGTEVCRPPAT